MNADSSSLRPEFRSNLPAARGRAARAASRLTRFEYIHILFNMSTTVHLPPDLLAAVDRRAQDLAVSRNRYIVRALSRAVAAETGWSARFVSMLAAARTDDEGRRALEDLRAAVAVGRTRKGPPAL